MHAVCGVTIDERQLERHLATMENTLVNVAYELTRVTRELALWREQLQLQNSGQQELPVTPTTPERQENP